MKRFLKKANRGLILGAFALVLLVIYIVVDYSSFSSEQPQIKEAVENYIGEFYKRLSEEDFSGISKLMNDTWTDEIVVEKSYYDDKEILSQFFEEVSNDEKDMKYGDITYKVKSMSVSKAGPGLAKVLMVYEASIEYGVSGNYMAPFMPYFTGWYVTEDEEELNKQYIYEVQYECDLYLRKVDGKWRIAQSSGMDIYCDRKEKESE